MSFCAAQVSELIYLLQLEAVQATVVRRLYQPSFQTRWPREMSHEITEQQAQKKVAVRSQLLQHPKENRLWRLVAAQDEKWIFFGSFAQSHWL